MRSTGKGTAARILGPDAYLRFDLDKPEFVSGLRFRFSLVDPSGMLPAMKVRWQTDSRPGASTIQLPLRVDDGGRG